MNIKEEVKEKLLNLQDLKYRDFHKNLCPGTNNIIGVRLPIIKSYAKELLKEYSFKELYKNIDIEYYEEIMLKGFIISFSKENFETKKEYITKFVPLINNWAICDSFSNSLKFTKQNKEEMRKLITKYLKSNKEFEIRFAIVMILCYYIEDDYLNENFEIFDNINNTSYYVEMALAWAISICLIKYYDETVEYLKRCNLTDFTYNKAIQKACESYRITDIQKQNLRKMKRGSR